MFWIGDGVIVPIPHMGLVHVSLLFPHKLVIVLIDYMLFFLTSRVSLLVKM